MPGPPGRPAPVEKRARNEVIAMPAGTPLLGISMIILVVVGVTFLVAVFYLADRGPGRHDGSGGRPRRRQRGERP